VREYGASIGVNPNTVMRTYEKLTDQGIIYNKRGIGYFISSDAKDIVLDAERKEFLENELPNVIKKMELLGLNPKELLLNGK
jgi:DNA-binding transcriptional regulator YhcF (GntR family)